MIFSVFTIFLAKNSIFWGQNLDFFKFNGSVGRSYQNFFIFFIVIVLQAITYTKNIALTHIEQITLEF